MPISALSHDDRRGPMRASAPTKMEEMQLNLNDYGPVPNTEAMPGLPARVTAQHKERYEVVCPRGFAYARLKSGVYYGGTEPFPTVGDFVTLNYVENGDSQILSTLPRRSFFSRREPGMPPREQAVAANFDYVMILQSLNQDFNPGRLERYLTMAWQSGATPVVLLTKADLTPAWEEFKTRAELAAPGVAVHALSARTGFGLEKLTPYLQPGKTLVFLGSSGVGKSSLLNVLAGETLMRVSGIREADGRGRHTTTHRQLLRLPSGVLIIDTPGMRELGLWEAAEGLSDSFADVERFLGKCRFSDCRHRREPGCAIRAALAAGELDPARWERWQKLKAETESREELLRRKTAWAKDVAVSRRQRKKNG